MADLYEITASPEKPPVTNGIKKLMSNLLDVESQRF